MRTFLLFYLLSRLLGNPLLALLALVVVALVLERGFLGVLPDLAKPWRGSARIRQLRAAVELTPFDARAQLDLGMLLLEAGKADSALPYLEQAAVKLADHATAQYALGAALVQTGRYAEGAAALRQAIAIRPEVQYGMPYVYLVTAKLQCSKADTRETAPAEVAEWVDTVIRYGNAETCYRMGVALQRNGLPDAAARLFREAVAGYRQSPAFARRAGRRWALFARLRLWRNGQRG